jgi:nucleotide-binding universal stress UspA family protein
LIVVGVDGSESAKAALRFALEEAQIRSLDVRAVAAWHIPAPAYGGAFDPGLADELEEAARATLERVLTEAGAEAAGVHVELVVREGAPARVLLDAADDANLLVVGSRGLGGFRGLLLGSVSQQCSQHAPCPVVIVPHERELRS